MSWKCKLKPKLKRTKIETKFHVSLVQEEHHAVVRCVLLAIAVCKYQLLLPQVLNCCLHKSISSQYTQQEGIDYEKTFTPMVRFTSIHMILTIVVHMDLELHQMDVKTTFFNRELDEEIYMLQPRLS